MNAPLNLADGMRQAGISYTELWNRYFGIGGSNTRDQIRHDIQNGGPADDHEHDVIAQAINESFLDRGGNHPVGYRHAGPRS